ncbi:MAG: twin-arginine translocase TatA/TatE family subunit [Anaerolineales bacterium]|nr:twin-arginine translocase TatA/TatE family subunit [Anaerolineales bacterium]
MNLGLPEILGILLVVIILFGVGRISKIGGELGSGIREFRNAVKDPDAEEEKEEEKESGEE